MVDKEIWHKVTELSDSLTAQRVADNPNYGRQLVLSIAEFQPILKAMADKGFPTQAEPFLAGYNDCRPVYDDLISWFIVTSNPRIKASLILPFQTTKARKWFPKLVELFKSTDDDFVRLQLTQVFAVVGVTKDLIQPILRLLRETNNGYIRNNLLTCIAKTKADGVSQLLVDILSIQTLTAQNVSTILFLLAKRNDIDLYLTATPYLNSVDKQIRENAKKCLRSSTTMSHQMR
jgi:hypothetical protein